MDASDWITIGVAAVSAGFSGFALRESRKANQSSGRSADAAVTAIRIQQAQRHEDLAPAIPHVIKADVYPDPRGPEFYRLVASIELKRDYWVRATRIGDNFHAPIAIGPFEAARDKLVFEIERWPPGQVAPTTTEILFKFWPPPGDNGIEPWSCLCEHPSDRDGDKGHWEFHRRVTYDDLLE